MRGLIDQLTEQDLSTLADVIGIPAEEIVKLGRRKPWRLMEYLAEESICEAILDRHTHPANAVSPTLLFAVLVSVTADELLDASYVNDWVGPRSRLPVFDVETLQDFVSDPVRVGFLARLLASFAAPEPPPVPANPFDVYSLVQWLDQVEGHDRFLLLRRLGDLALFMTGVFPDRTGSEPLRPLDAMRLGASIGMTSDEILALSDPASVAPGLDALELLGKRWYEASGSSEVVVLDIAQRFRAARRVLNHLTDTYLYKVEVGWPRAG